MLCAALFYAREHRNGKFLAFVFFLEVEIPFVLLYFGKNSRYKSVGGREEVPQNGPISLSKRKKKVNHVLLLPRD